MDGRKYRSSRLIAVRVNFPRSAAGSWVANYPPGSVVTARRHPRKPELAVLQPGMQGFDDQYRIPCFMGGGLPVIGAVGWIVLS